MRILSKKVAEVHPGKYVVWCSACGMLHGFFNLYTGAVWVWDGDANNPTFSPSLVVDVTFADKNRSPLHCHSFLRKGVWWYLNDCSHELAGQEVLLPNLPDHILERGGET